MPVPLKRKLKARLGLVWSEQATVNIGKKGITENILNEISQQLERHELIKIKFLANYLTDNFDKDIKLLTKKTQSSFVEKRGKVIIIYKSKAKAQ